MDGLIGKLVIKDQGGDTNFVCTVKKSASGGFFLQDLYTGVNHQNLTTADMEGLKKETAPNLQLV